jgi:hypothetical protein
MGRCGIGSGGVPRPSLADYVMGTGAMRGATAVVASPCNDRYRTDRDHRPGTIPRADFEATSIRGPGLGALSQQPEPSIKTRAGSLAERLLDRCITAELALDWGPDRAIKLPWWAHAGVTLDPRWSHAGPLGMTSSGRALRSRSSRASWDEARTGPRLRTHGGLEVLGPSILSVWRRLTTRSGICGSMLGNGPASDVLDCPLTRN